MNASGRLNTCKSRGREELALLETGKRVRNTYAICPYLGDSPEKFGLIPNSIIGWHHLIIKELRIRMSVRKIS